jgi:hypothetical protein
MGTHVITELDQQLASLNQLKAPGASKGKISSITTLCVNNIQVSFLSGATACFRIPASTVCSLYKN